MPWISGAQERLYYLGILRQPLNRPTVPNAMKKPASADQYVYHILPGNQPTPLLCSKIVIIIYRL